MQRCQTRAEVNNLEMYRTYAVNAAKELFYPKDVIKKIMTAKTIGEIQRIMTDARKAGFEN